MTIRSLAADLGISPMALYHHVRDKDDLLDEVVDRLLVRAWKPRVDPTDGRAWTPKPPTGSAASWSLSPPLSHPPGRPPSRRRPHGG
jgi:AcrR family transcriptional regulator